MTEKMDGVHFVGDARSHDVAIPALREAAVLAATMGIELLLTPQGLSLESLGPTCAEHVISWLQLEQARDPGGIVRCELLRMCEEAKS